MRRRGPSRAAERESGFTLIELLVVLALIGLLLMATPALMAAARPGVDVRTAAQDLANALRGARGAAIVGNRPTHMVLDTSARSYVVEPGGRLRRLPKGVTISVRRGGEEGGGGRADIAFFPDGSSSGGAIRLSASAQTRWVVVQLLSGRVWIHD